VDLPTPWGVLPGRRRFKFTIYDARSAREQPGFEHVAALKHFRKSKLKMAKCRIDRRPDVFLTSRMGNDFATRADHRTACRHFALRPFHQALKRCGVRVTRDVLAVSIASQRMTHFRMPAAAARAPNGLAEHGAIKRFVISTSRFGIGQVEGSNCTPLGLHRIAQKIGGGWPVGTAFKSRQAIGFTWQGLSEAKITTRILWLEGLEPGLNRGGKVDSHSRYIYIHGTGDETTLGRPASCGCIQVSSDDLIPLFDRVPEGTLVWIAER
jgi:hypothetical protein